ncbi:glycosyltransferase family 39 protein [Gemmatimonadota bacterium]
MSATALLVYLASIKLLIPLVTSSDFGFHRDEFLYLAMGEHLSWGYLEVPPLTAIFAKIVSSLLGGSLVAVRLFPSIIGGLTLILTGLITRELGGGRFAQVLAGVSYLCSVVYLRINLLFQPVSFDLFCFVLGVYLLIRILKRSEPRLWIMLGVVTGLGLLNKYSMLLFAFGAVVGLLLSSRRHLLKSGWPWLAAAIALLVVLPNLIWQSAQGWPFLEHMRVLSESQLAHVEPAGFILTQLLMYLFAGPVWLIGLYFYLKAGEGREFRAIGWMYVSLFLVLLFLSGKAYYLAPAYPMLFAGGALTIERYVHRTARTWMKPALLGFIVLGGVIVLPVGIPFLSQESAIRYFDFASRNMGMEEALRWETGDIHVLPQDYADMLGWEELAATVAENYAALTADERERCTVFAANYGAAGTLQYYADRYGLPSVISQSGSNWLWGYGDSSGEILITVGFEREYLERIYDTVAPGIPFTHPHARESGIPIYLVRDPIESLADIWTHLKAYRY